MGIRPKVGEVGGQTFSVLRSIQSLLNQMAEGGIDTAGTVIKELLQNADDAGATELSVLLDERQLPGGPDERYEALYSPALLIRNNASFRLASEVEGQGDFAALCDVANGHKRDQATAAGRFGIGFNSVYFLTDTPILFSRREVHIFDLTNRVLQAPANGWKFDLASFPNVASGNAGPVKSVLEWCFPKAVLGERSFGGWASDISGDFRQTVLRLPLRRSEQGTPAVQVDRFTDATARRRVLVEMAKEASKSLLFLKTTHSASFGILGLDGTIDMVATIAADPLPAEFFSFIQDLNALAKDDGGPSLNVNFRRSISRHGCQGPELSPETWNFHVWHSARFDAADLMKLRSRLSRNGERATPWAAMAVPLDASSCRIDGEGPARWRVFLPLVEQGPSNCLFNAALFVGPSRKYTEFREDESDEGTRRTAWNKLLVERALVPMLQDVSLDLPDIASDLLRDSPSDYLSLFPRVRPDAHGAESGLAVHFAQKFCSEPWLLRLPDLWGDQFDILMGANAEELIVERIPAWLAEYAEHFKELSTPSRRFVPEVLGAALSSRVDQRGSLILKDESGDVALAVLAHQEPPKATHLKALLRIAAKSGFTREELQNCWAFERADGSGLLRYDSEMLYVVASASKAKEHPAVAELQHLGIDFEDTEWVSGDVGLTAPKSKIASKLDNIVELGAAAVVRLLARLPASNSHDQVAQPRRVSAIVDFLSDQKTLPQDLKLGFMVRTAANKEGRRSCGVILVKPVEPTELDKALWDLWFKKFLPEVDPGFGTLLVKLHTKHPNSLQQMHANDCTVMLGTTEHALNILDVVRKRQPGLFSDFQTRINEPVVRQGALADQVWRLVVKLLGEAEAHWDELDEDKRHTLLALPVHRMPTGEYTQLAEANGDDGAAIQARFRLQPARDGEDIADAPVSVPTFVLLNAPNVDLRRLYRKRLNLVEHDRVAVLRDVLDQIGKADNDANGRMLQYLAEHYLRKVRELQATGDDLDAQDAVDLRDRFSAATLVPCLDGSWRTALDCAGAWSVSERLKNLGWRDADADRIIPQLFPADPVCRTRGQERRFLHQLDLALPEMEAESIARQAVLSESCDLQLRDRVRLLRDNWKDRPNPTEPMAQAVRGMQVPILGGGGRARLGSTCYLASRPSLPGPVLRGLAPEAVDVAVLATELDVPANDLPDTLQALGVPALSIGELDDRLVAHFAEFWPRQPEDRKQVLRYVAKQNLACRLVDAAAGVDCVPVTSKPLIWRQPTEVLTPSWAATSPPFAPDNVLPACDGEDDQAAKVWEEWCAVDGFSGVLSIVLAGAGKTRDVVAAAKKVNDWLETEVVSPQRDEHALASSNWVLARRNGQVEFRRPDEVLSHESLEILAARFWVPAIPLPAFASKSPARLGFMRRPPATEESLQMLAECLSQHAAAKDRGAAERVYGLVEELLQDPGNPSLKGEAWPAIAKRFPVFLSFRTTVPHVDSRQLFIGDDVFQVDLSPKLICLRVAGDLPDSLLESYRRLGAPPRPTLEQVIHALSRLDGVQTNQKAIHTGLVRALDKLDSPTSAPIPADELGGVCVLTCDGTLESISKCLWDDRLGKKGHVGAGAHRLVDTGESANNSLRKWLADKGLVISTLRGAAELAVDENPNRVLESPELADFLQPWRQWTAEAARNGSALRDELEANDLAPSGESIGVVPVERICLRYRLADGTVVEQAASWDGPLALADLRDRLLVRVPKDPKSVADKDVEGLDKAAAGEIARRFGATTAVAHDAAVELILRTLERPRTILARLRETNSRHSFHQYQDQNADLEFARVFEEYQRTGDTAKRKREELEQELRRLLELGFVRGRREQIRGYGYDEFSVFAELLQNAEDAYVQGAQLGMDKPTPCSISFRFPARSEDCQVLEVQHFGRPFNYWRHGERSDPAYSRDVEGVLRSAGSFKPLAQPAAAGGAQGKTIGRFGLGFKSVYLLTDRPEVHSGAWHFAIVAGCLPQALPSPNDLPAGATRFRIPFRDDAAVEVDAGRLIELLPFLAQIRRLEFEACDGTCETFVTECSAHSSAGATDVDLVTLSGPIPGRNGEVRLLRSRSQNHAGQLALLLAEDGTPVRWDEVFDVDMYVTLPLRANLGCGAAVSHQFEVQSGRTHLVDPTVNAARFKEIASLVAGLVEGVRACAGNASPLSRVLTRFWALWDWDRGDLESLLLRRDIAAAVAQAAESAKIIPTLDRDVAVNLTGAQLLYFAELPELFRDAVVASSVEIGIEPTGATTICPQNVVADGFYGAYRRACEFGLIQPKSQIAKVGWREISTALRDRAWLAEKPGLLTALADSIPKDQVEKVASWLGECEILAEDGSGKPIRAKPPLVLSRDFPGRQHLAPRWLTRPSSKYSDAALQLLTKAGVRSAPSSEELRQWLKSKETSSGECCGVLSYLCEDGRFHDFRDLEAFFGSQWFPAKGRRISTPEAIAMQLIPVHLLGNATFRAWIGAGEPTPLPPPTPPTLPRPDAKRVLEDLYSWWQLHGARWTREKYEPRLYPSDRPLNLRQPFNHRDGSQRRDWVTLLLLGALHTLGRTRFEQHRDFLRRCERKGWLDIFAAADQDARAWFRILEEYVDDPNGREDYLQWMKQFITIFQISRWLSEYVEAFQSVRVMSRPFGLDALTAPRTNPQFAGGGPDAPPLSRALGMGACFVLRELHRVGHVDQQLAHRYCFVPARRVCDLLADLGCSNIRADSHADKSIAAHAFLVRNLDASRATFGRSFDLPLLALAESRELQSEILRVPAASLEAVLPNVWPARSTGDGDWITLWDGRKVPVNR